MRAKALALAVAAGLAATAEGLKVWTGIKGEEAPLPDDERRANIPHIPVVVDHAALVAELESDVPTLEFDLPGAIIINCTMKSSSVMHPGLAAKFPHIKSLIGRCMDGTDVSLNIDTTVDGSFQATIYTQDSTLYADTIANDTYMVYSQVHAPSKEDDTERANDEVFTIPGLESRVPLVREDVKRDPTEQINGYKYRMAVLTTAEYAALHGGTLSSVMLSIVKTMSRVNSVFYREAGVFFELIENNDLLICLPSDTTCNGWPNTLFLSLKTREIMEKRGVSQDMYDIGHGFTTEHRGITYFKYSSWASYVKEAAVTGMDSSVEEPYLIIRLIHYIAAQIGVKETSRECNYSSSRLEPGAGQSLMGSARPCSSDETHSVRDTFFHAFSVAILRYLLEASARYEERFLFEARLPPRNAVLEDLRCAVPKGNHVQLSGKLIVDDSSRVSYKYSWERFDFGYEPYQDTDVPRFRPWAPRSSVTRFLPNMYYLTYGLGSQLDELPPKASVPGDVEMTFAFIVRKLYAPNAEEQSFNAETIGAQRGTSSFQLWYKSNEEPLRITTDLNTLQAGTSILLTWTGGLMTSTVEVMLAVNTMTEVDDFRGQDDLKDLDWVSAGVFRNNGSAVVYIPQLSSSSGKEVNLMLRSTGNQHCYFFDLVPRLTFLGGTSGTASPTVPTLPIPTASPVTFSPTTPSPTRSPTLTPTAPDGWTCFDVEYGDGVFCNCECGIWDPDCDLYPYFLLCGTKPRDERFFRCSELTSTCVSTDHPISTPTNSPTSTPTISPTSTPTISPPTSTTTVSLFGTPEILAGIGAGIFAVGLRFYINFKVARCNNTRAQNAAGVTTYNPAAQKA